MEMAVVMCVLPALGRVLAPCVLTILTFRDRRRQSRTSPTGRVWVIRKNGPVTQLDWHADRSWAARLDDAPESVGIDLGAVRRYRLRRVRAEMERRNVAALVLSDPVNIRYATGSRNMQVFTSRNAPSRYLLLTHDRSILYEFTGCEHLADELDTIDETRVAVTASFVAAGPRIAEREQAWAAEMASTIRDLVGMGSHVVGLERMNAGTAIALAAQGLTIVDAQEPVEMARAIKSAGEVDCIRASLRMTEAAVHEMRNALAPGITENELWAVLHRAVIAGDADYCETRLLNSGPRTNPWFQETAPRVIRRERTRRARHRRGGVSWLLLRLLAHVPRRARRSDR